MSQTVHQYQVQDLAEFMHKAKSNNKPFVFFTGAGCSVSAGIPLAAKLIDEMHQRFPTELKVLSADDRTNYGKCMAQIGRDDRRQFLKSYIGDSKINWAHIALACLLKAGYIGRVLTFNFDNLLARSCGLLGLYPATYDFTSANLNLYHLIENPAIVHLHGQSHGFAQLNSEEETGSHAQQLSQFVCSTLNESPALFIGYSGQADAFFPQIKKHFSGQHRLFWVDMAEQAPAHIADSILQTSLAHYMRCADGADLFLIELARQLGCFPPMIFTDPYAHLLEELEAVSAYPQRTEHKATIGDLSDTGHTDSTNTQDILQGLRLLLTRARQREIDVERPNYLELYLEGKYQEIVQEIEQYKYLRDVDEIWLARCYFSLALKQTSEVEEILFYDKILARFFNSQELSIQEQVANALVNKGYILGELGNISEALVVYDTLISYANKYGDLVLQRLSARCLLNKSTLLSRAGDLKSAIDICDQLIRRFIGFTDSILSLSVVRSFLYKSFYLWEDGCHDDSITAYDKLIENFGEAKNILVRQGVAEAFLNKASRLKQIGRQEDMMNTYDDLIGFFGESTESVLLHQVAKAENFKGFSLLIASKANWDVQKQSYQKLSMAFSLFQQAVSKSSSDDLAITLGNLAYVEFLLGQPEQAEAHLREALEKGGETLYHATLDDIAMHPIAPDAEFKALLERVWQSISPS